MRTTLVVLLLLLAPAAAWAQNAIAPPTTPGTDGKDSFREGVESFRAGNYESALSSFGEAREALPMVGDYILLFMARAHLEMKRPQEALKAIARLKEEHPSSPLVKDALALEIKSLLAEETIGVLPLIESYTSRYPSDMEMRLLHGKLLKEEGQREEADAVLREIYISAGPFSKEAHKAMKQRDLRPEDRLRRAVNLIQRGSYAEAEDILRSLLKKNYSPGEDVRKNLALCLFRQRKYSEAAGAYLEVDDLYNAARASLRAGREDDFYRTLDEMITRKDPKAADLMVALADSLRRSGSAPNALELLSEARAVFPASAEQALWAEGWTYYTQGNFPKAVESFRRLHESYGASKYLYWRARAAEKAGRNAAGLYGKLEGGDYYFYLSRTKTAGRRPLPASTSQARAASVPMERVDALIDAGLTAEAEFELTLLTQRHTSYGELMSIAYKFMSIEKYRNALLLADLLPVHMKPAEVLYPLAFWPIVEQAASQYGMDPLLLLSVMREESRFDPMAVSVAGARGLMQLMPHTARRVAKGLDLRLDGEESIHEVENNITIGARYLSGLIGRFDSVPPALAAYNAGERTVRRWLERSQYDGIDEFIEDIPYEETRNYVKRIITSYHRYRDAGYATAGVGPGML